jgi:ubiquitin-activating enzyme E1
MDTIEKSNLSRQLLFRDGDIGKFKSKAAQESIQMMNPAMKMESHTSKVGDVEDSTPFNFHFWSKRVDVVLNALDNMEARLFIDAQCVTNQKALIDAGTLGSKGNVQVVIPHKSESYGSSADPPEPAIPVCTLKNFPYAISHTIQWGRDLFDGLFVRRPRQINQYADTLSKMKLADFAIKLEHDLGDQAALEASTEISEDFLVLLENSARDDNQMKEKAIEWAVSLARRLFHDAIEELLQEHPPDSVDEDGEKFWSGPRKMPKSLLFSVQAHGMQNQQEEINQNMIDFVRSAARLRYETYIGIPDNSSLNLSLISEDKVVEFLRVTLLKQTDSKDLGSKQGTNQNVKTQIKDTLSPLQSFPDKSSMACTTLSVAEFEKDDDSNDHIAFITAASNLRAICYGIPPVDSMETRKVAGKIVPAMITTTAFVSALSCIELVKLCMKGTTLRSHRNAFINLALPFFAFTSPLPAEEYPGLRGKTHTLWDRIIVKESEKAARSGGLTLRHFLKRIAKKAYTEDPNVVQVTSISFGPFMVYANFLHEDDNELLDKTIWQVVEEAVTSGNDFDLEFSRDDTEIPRPAEKKGDNDLLPPYLDLTVVVEDMETGDEVELPPVRIVRSETTE